MCTDLYGLLKALVLPLQLLSLRQTAGVQHAGRQHDLTFGDPAQHLSYTHAGRQVFSRVSARVCMGVCESYLFDLALQVSQLQILLQQCVCVIRNLLQLLLFVL